MTRRSTVSLETKMTEAIKKANELKQAEAIKIANERTRIAENQVLILSVQLLVLTRLLAQAPPPQVPETLLVPESPVPASDDGPAPEDEEPDTGQETCGPAPPSSFVIIAPPMKPVIVMNGSCDDNCYVNSDSSL